MQSNALNTGKHTDIILVLMNSKTFNVFLLPRTTFYNVFMLIWIWKGNIQRSNNMEDFRFSKLECTLYL